MFCWLRFVLFIRALLHQIVLFCFMFESAGWPSHQRPRSAWCGYKGQRSKYKELKRGEKHFTSVWLAWREKKTSQSGNLMPFRTNLCKDVQNVRKRINQLKAQNTAWLKRRQTAPVLCFLYIDIPEKASHTWLFPSHLLPLLGGMMSDDGEFVSAVLASSCVSTFEHLSALGIYSTYCTWCKCAHSAAVSFSSITSQKTVYYNMRQSDLLSYERIKFGK